MAFTLHHFSPRRLAAFLCALLLGVGLFLNSAQPIRAQSSDDQTYNCGVYGEGEFGSNDCLAAAEATPTPTPTPSQSGLFPITGGQITLWAAIGALILAIGLGLYGYSHRTKRNHAGGAR